MQGNSHQCDTLNFKKYKSNLRIRRTISTKDTEATAWSSIGKLNYMASKMIINEIIEYKIIKP